MRRRSGADIVEIDTFAGTCRFWYTTPRQIDFPSIVQASLDSSYKLVEIRLNILGEIREEGDRKSFVSAAGQSFEVEGGEGLEGEVHLHATVEGWSSASPRLEVEHGHPIHSP